MRIATASIDGTPVPGIVVEDRFVDVSDEFAGAVEVVEASMTEEGRARITAAVESNASERSSSLVDVQLLPPISSPQRILCVGKNYQAHVDELGRPPVAPDHPVMFTRFPSSLVGHDEPLVRPTASDHFDFEGELAIVIGRTTRNAERSTALDAVAGYSCFMDGTLRDYQRHTPQFTPGKNFDRSGSWGPWIVTPDEVGDPYALALETILDGEVMQSAPTTQMIFDIETVIAYCSTFTTLEPGDVIATGTPGGVGSARDPQRWLTPGESLTVSIPGVGTLTNPVVDESSG